MRYPLDYSVPAGCAGGVTDDWSTSDDSTVAEREEDPRGRAASVRRDPPAGG